MQDHINEPIFRDVTRRTHRQPGERHVLPVAIPDYVRRNMDGTSVAGSEPVLQDGNVDENSPSVGKPKLSREDLEEIFNALDINADGQISMIEFIKGLRADPVMAQTLGLPSDIRQVRPCSVNILAARAHMRLEHSHVCILSGDRKNIRGRCSSMLLAVST